MELSQAQENLSHLVNIDALAGKLKSRNPTCLDFNSKNEAEAGGALARLRPEFLIKTKMLSMPAVEPKEPIKKPMGAGTNRSPTQIIDWPSKVLSEKLKVKLDRGQYEGLNQVLELLINDIMASRDRLLSLNPGRRKMIEHRLEFIARKVARARGEKLGRSLSLPEILKDSYRENTQTQHKLGVIAWKGFALEVALYHVLELFFLKCLDARGWRNFQTEDLGRLNFAAHSFLSQQAAGFAHDRHCWNFVRTNLYSWHIPSKKALTELSAVLSGPMRFSWTDIDLLDWITSLPPELKASHLDFSGDRRLGERIAEFLERELDMPLTSAFQGRPACKKFFLPALELGGPALSILDGLLEQVQDAATHESSQFHRAIWSCESESFEAFWAEVLSLLKFLRAAKGSRQPGNPIGTLDDDNPLAINRLPHSLHVVQMLGLELHNLEQLPLTGPEISKLHQGSASQIQQMENFDAAIVTDHPDRSKSARWMRALAEQLPYWRNFVSTSTNLNWGELHLHLAVTKLKEGGCVVYVSHRVLPEGGDGERLRKSLLGLAQLECFIELHEEAHRPYRYLYVFRRNSSKLERDGHRPRFGVLKKAEDRIELASLEEANSTQGEIAERGWDHLFVRGAAPLVRHLNHKFPKLFQLATVQVHHGSNNSNSIGENSLFENGSIKALQATYRFTAVENPAPLVFRPLSSVSDAKSDRVFIFPHNPVDLPWIQCLLNSSAAQFWIRHQLIATAAPGKPLKFSELRSCPIVDLSHAPADAVHEALAWMDATKPNQSGLRAWACRPDAPLIERYAKYVAMAKRYAMIERVVIRYRPLFTSDTFEEMRPEAVAQFYPSNLLCHLSQSPDIRIQYVERARSALPSDSWTIADIHAVLQNTNGRPMAYVVAHTRQGPHIQMLVPEPIREYICSQLRTLCGHTWGEALSMARVPRDIGLFTAQTAEITQVVMKTAQEMAFYTPVLEEMALELFEIPLEVRQFLAH